MSSIKVRRVLTAGGAVGLGALAHCSVFDLSVLTNAESDAYLDASPTGPLKAGDLGAVSNAPGDLPALDSSTAGDDACSVDAVVEAPADTGNEGGQDAGSMDAASDATADSTNLHPTADSTNLDATADAGGLDAGWPDTEGPDGVSDGGDITTGLVALYLFDETAGTTAADSSGNGQTGMMQGATFTPGLRGNAATMSGAGQYVILPPNITSGLSSFSISVWANVGAAPPPWCRIFDFGNGTTAYMFLTPNAGTLRFAMSTSGNTAEQQLNSPALATASWQHVAITVAGAVGTLYVAGAQVAQNAAMTLTPSTLGITTQNWLGRSQFSSDRYLTGQIDNLRIYSRALSASEVNQLFMQRL